jgi:hypothetical protein
MNRIKFVTVLIALSLAIPTANATDTQIVNCSLVGNFTIKHNVIETNFDCAGDAVIPNSVTTIGWDAFRDAISLLSITIPNSVTTIGNNAFYGTRSLRSFTVDSANPKFSSDNQGVLYDKEKKILMQAPLAKSTIVMPDTVVMILDGAFWAAKSLYTLIIPNTVKLPGLGLIADAKAVAEAKAVAKKRTTITCIKGKLVKKITTVKPKCPIGYKVKR